MIGSNDSQDDRTGRGDHYVGKLASQSLTLLSTGGFSYVGALLLQIFLARILGLEEFGRWAVAFSFVEMLSVVGLMGGDWLLLRQGSYYQSIGDEPRLRGTLHLALLLGGVTLTGLGTILFLLSSFIASQVFHSQQMIVLIRLAAVVGPMVGIRQIMIYGTQAFRSVRDAALVRNVLQPVARLVFVAFAVLQSQTPMSAFVGLLASEAILAVVAGVLLNRRVRLIGRTDPIEIRALIGFAGAVLGTRLVEGVRMQIFPLLLGAMATLSASGLFIACRRLTLVPGLMTSAMNQVYSPLASDLYLRDQQAGLAELAKSMTKWIFSLAFPFFCLLVFFPAEILTLFGDSFRHASSALVLMSIGMLFLIGTGPVTTTLLAAGHSRLVFIDYVLAVGTEVLLAILLIPPYGINGAAIAAMCGKAVNNAIPLAQVWLKLGFHPYAFAYWKPVAAGLTATGIARLLLTVAELESGIAAATAAVLVGVIYIALIWLFRISAEDKAVINRLLRRGQSREPSSELLD